MRDPARIEPILNEIRRIWTQYPDLRLTQLLVAVIPEAVPSPRFFYFEDSDLIRRLREYPPADRHEIIG